MVSTDEDIDILCKKAKRWILHYAGQQSLDFDGSNKAESDIAHALSNITHLLLNAPQQILSKVYDSIGFNVINDNILRHLVIARICCKSNLEMRPIFHFTEKRIEAHICICFIAYKVYVISKF